METSNTEFLFDDFFGSEDDPGIVVEIKIRGRQVPITLRRGLTLADQMACQAAALKKRLVNGSIVMDGLDEAILVEEMMVRAIKAWPFQFKGGTPVPVTRENIRKMLGGADEIADAIKKLSTEGEAALAPFVPASGAA
jgi:hypothetical protein